MKREDMMMAIINNRIDEREIDERLSAFIEDDLQNDVQQSMPRRPVYNVTDLRRDMGFLEKMTVDRASKKKRPIFVPKASFYANRGIALRDLNLMEYYSLIQYAVRLKNDTPRRNARFPFAPTFECSSDYDQMLLSKQRTPVVLRKPPPHPGEQPSNESSTHYTRWKARADLYARYYLTLYRPERDSYSVDTRHDYSYTWPDLCEFVHSLSHDRCVLSKFRLMSMHRRMRGFYTLYDNKVMLSRFRSRNRDEWDSETRDAIRQENHLRQGGNEDLYNQTIPEYELTNEQKVFSEAENKSIKKILHGTGCLIDAYCSTKCKKRRQRGNLSVPFPESNIACGRDAGQVQLFAHNLRNSQPVSNNYGVFRHSRNMFSHFVKVREHKSWVKKLKPRQREVYNIY
jgi:hypothetical protein